MNYFKRPTGHKGYTLIELLLYIAIIGTLLVSVLGFYALALDARVKNQAISEVNQQGTFAIEYVTSAIRNATSITTPAVGGTAASLTLAMPSASVDPSVFSLSGSTLQVAEGASAAAPLTNSHVQISSIQFKNLTRPGTTGIVQVSFIVSSVNSSGQSRYSYQKTFTASAEVAQ